MIIVAQHQTADFIAFSPRFLHQYADVQRDVGNFIFRQDVAGELIDDVGNMHGNRVDQRIIRLDAFKLQVGDLDVVFQAQKQIFST